MSAHSERARLLWRKILNVVMLSLTGVAALGVVSILFLILGYLIYNGGHSLSLHFFTELPKPVGETGGGMANAIVGSLKLLFLAAVIGLPIGLMTGVYLAEFGGKTFSFVIRYTNDLLNGVPLHRHRYFRVFTRCAARETLFCAGGRRGSRDDGRARHRPQHRRISEGRAEQHARSRHGSRRQPLEDHRHRRAACGERRHPHRYAPSSSRASPVKPRRCSSPRSTTVSGATAGASRLRHCP